MTPGPNPGPDEVEALRDIAERHRQLADNLPDGFIYQVIQSPDGAVRFSYASAGVEALCGVTPEEVTADPAALYGRILPEDLPRVRAAEEQAVRGRTVFDCQFRHHGRDGEVRWLHCRSAPRPLPDGRTAWDGIAVDITERVRAAEALRHERELLQAIIDSIPVMITLYRPDTRVLRLNPEFERVTGWAVPEGGGASLMEQCYPDPAHREQVRQYMQTCAAGWRDFRLRTRDGRELETAWANIRLSDGRQVGIGLDVSARRRADAALRESEERYRDLFENANDIIYTLDLEGRITSANKRAEQTFGYATEEMLGRSAAAIVAPEYHARMLDALRRKLAGEAAPTVYELEVVCKDGRRVPLEVSSRLIVRGGRPVGVQGIARDVTERRRAERALRDSERMLAQSQRAAHVGSWELDLTNLDDINANPLRWSDETYRIFGYEPASVKATNDLFFQAVPPDDRAAIVAAVAQALRGNQPYEIEHRITRADGAGRVVQQWATVERGPDGRPLRMVGTCQDVTERRQIEEALREADRRKDEFLAVLSHELRNPLAPIRNGLAVLRQRGDQDPTVGRVLTLMERQVAHAVRLIDDLLDVSRVTHGKIELRKEPVVLADIVARALEEARPAGLEERSHRVEVAVAPEPLLLHADPVRVQQILTNLLTNAAKYTPPGGRISLRVTREGGEAVIRVRDDGIGIRPEMLRRIFEMFTQADRVAGRLSEGLGLGLPLVKSLAELHGGTVEAHSDGPGKGSEFVVRLPLTVDGGRWTVDGGKRPSPSIVYRPPSTHRILVVDDNRDAVESLAMLLRLDGHEVRVAHDGPRALEAAAAFAPQVVLLDIGMPGMSGYEVARRLRADGGPACPLLVAMTGYGQDEDRRRSREAGFDHHLVKPVEFEVVLALLAREAGHRPGPHERPPAAPASSPGGPGSHVVR
jgi:two-component system CheB/CheR fusion protein